MGIQTAADILWPHKDPLVYHKLVRQRGWPVTRFRGWLAAALQAQQLVRRRYAICPQRP